MVEFFIYSLLPHFFPPPKVMVLGSFLKSIMNKKCSVIKIMLLCLIPDFIQIF